MDINESRQIFDSLDDDKKRELTKLIQYPLLLTSIIRQASDLIRTNISIEYSSDFEKKVILKLISLCDIMDNTSYIVDKMIRDEHEKFLTDLKESNITKKSEDVKKIELPNKTRSFNKSE